MATIAQHTRGTGAGRLDSPRIAGRIMLATYAIGGVGIFVGASRQGAGGWAAAIDPVVAISVGVVGVLAFVRHSVFHRSDAARMGWDYGRRNDFQIEVGIANLAWGCVGITAYLLAWSAQAKGAVTLVFGLYMLGAALLHSGDLRKSRSEGGGRTGSLVGSACFAVALIVFGVGAATT